MTQPRLSSAEEAEGTLAMVLTDLDLIKREVRELLQWMAAERVMRLQAVAAAAPPGTASPDCTCARRHSAGRQGRHETPCAISVASAQRRAKRARDTK